MSAVAGQRADCQWDLPGRCIRRSSWATWSLKFVPVQKNRHVKGLKQNYKIQIGGSVHSSQKLCVSPKSIGKYPKRCITCPVNQGTIFPHRSFMLVLPIALGDLVPPLMETRGKKIGFKPDPSAVIQGFFRVSR